MNKVPCPKCSSVCTPCGNDFYVCDACGYGKESTDKPIRSPFLSNVRGKQYGHTM